MGPNSLMVVYVDPLGKELGELLGCSTDCGVARQFLKLSVCNPKLESS